MPKKTLSKTQAGARAVAVPAAVPVTETVTPTATVVPVQTVPSREEIARRAYEIFVARGQAPGQELEDWLQAERELKAHRNN